MITYAQLVEKYKTVSEGTIIYIDNNKHTVITNIYDDCIFLVNSLDESKSFHLFYDELDPNTDDFTIVGN